MSLLLPRGCRTGKISVHPKNWEDPGATTSGDWFIHYRFQDPNFKDKYPKGYPVQVRGMNHVKGLLERRKFTRAFIENEKANLQAGYNPILKKIVLEENDLEISPFCPFLTALNKAYALLEGSKTKNEIRKALAHIGTAVQQLQYESIPIADIRRRHIKAVLEKIARNKKEANGKEWGASSYNHYRTYLDILFGQLDEVEATEVDPVAKVKKKRTLKKIRKVPSTDEVRLIDDQVKANYYTFWRFIHIFFHSGARMAELMQVRVQDVQLQDQRFLVTIRKGRGEMEEVYKTITQAALPLWEEVMNEASPGQYLFAKGLKPGAAAINEHQVTRRWRVHVKKKLGIEADFYSLKHKNSTEIVSSVVSRLNEGAQAAADRNSHKSSTMVNKTYDVDRAAREHAELRKIDAQLN